MEESWQVLRQSTCRHAISLKATHWHLHGVLSALPACWSSPQHRMSSMDHSQRTCVSFSWSDPGHCTEEHHFQKDLWPRTARINVYASLPDLSWRMLEQQKMVKSDLEGTWGHRCCICRSLGTDYRQCPWQNCNHQTSWSSWSCSIFWCGRTLHPIQLHGSRHTQLGLSSHSNR